MTANAIGRE